MRGFTHTLPEALCGLLMKIAADRGIARIGFLRRQRFTRVLAEPVGFSLSHLRKFTAIARIFC